jgi:hypothetical protein
VRLLAPVTPAMNLMATSLLLRQTAAATREFGWPDASVDESEIRLSRAKW